MTEPVSTSSAIKVSEDDYDYEDDFEQDINNDSTPERVKGQSDGNGTDSDASPDAKTSSGGVEKGQMEMENSSKERSMDEASNNELDAMTISQRQNELVTGHHEHEDKQEDSDLSDEEPPEYNVKGRLEQLNAELAKDPVPVEGDREHKVGFKSEIVDLVAPPPTFSDDESSQPNSARGESDGQDSKSAPPSADTSSSPTYDKFSDKEDKKQKQFVVEREGNFEVLNENDLTASERTLYVSEEDKDSKDNQNHKRKENSDSSVENKNSNHSDTSTTVHPRPPPARPRPNTAGTVGLRRNVRPAHSPRPKSANYSSESNTSLDNFSYNSPYAMSPEQKEQARQIGKKSEEERAERGKKKQEDDETKRKDNESAFQAWLHAKSEEDRRRQSLENGGKNSDSDRKESCDEAFKTWLKEKRNQGKKDKLLKRRQQQEMMEGYYVRPREDCEQAFKEWLKKKNAALTQQQKIERQRNRLFRIQVKKSKKTQALVKAMKESQSFRYVDYYGYRF